MNYYVLLFLSIVVFSTCQKVDKKDDLSNCDFKTTNHFPCGSEVIEDSVRFDTISTIFKAVSNIDIIDDCLSFDITSSGCSGDSWIVNVVDAQTKEFTNPMSKDLKIEFFNKELCEALITKEFFFDLFPLRECTDSIINLNIVNADTSVLYFYH